MTIDLRSDTVTRPTPEMRQAMAQAAVGDDVLGDDPTVIELQELGAEMLGKEAALFFPSGTQSNLAAVMSHCQRGDEYLVGETAHTYKYEAGGAAVLGSVQPQTIPYESDWTFDFDAAGSLVKPADAHFANTKLLCIENTVHGRVLPLPFHSQARRFADANGLGLHLDGARLINAAVASQVTIADLSRDSDTVSICLSKGLGAPVGSLLAGSEDMVREAHRWRKVLGGGMRQAGVLAAAGVVALRSGVDHIATDHDNAQHLASGLAELDGVKVVEDSVQSNMVFAEVRDSASLAEHFRSRDVLVLDADPMRFVTHRDIGRDDVERVLEVARDWAG